MIGHRLQQIMNHYHLSPAIFSEKLHIQRSSLSHFFSGRNKPGWDFLEKLSRTFPQINIHWFITGEGSMLLDKYTNNTDVNDFTNVFTSVKDSHSNTEHDNSNSSTSKHHFSHTSNEDLSTKNIEDAPKKREVAQVIVLFSDNTCKVYRSE